MANTKAIGGGLLLLFLIIVIGAVAWSFMAQNNDANEAFSKGCTATTASWTGAPSTYSCPPGTVLSWNK